ncbi:hypothetical protein [Vallitalea maricola]|uniref:Uncharacterized protein n=1 Tax=Vallitalea maricola TaxID=3074433 RepID=A0ACB5UK87_9FIRM|nr:hypothetical protein AN2V17_21900 [Vallitalea sp. AN17-2]
MKKIAFIIFTTVILLCSCSKKADPDYPEFSKTNWGMSMAETLNAYGISEKDTSHYVEDSVFSVKGYELFGEKTSIIIFNFINFKKGNPKLCSVKVNYPESADLNNVLKEMKKVYGETVSNISIYDLFQVFEDKLPVKEYTESDHLKLWANNKSVLQSIPENQHENYRNLWKNYQTSLRDDNWDTFSKNAKMVTVVWSDNGEFPSLEKYALDFNGYNLVVFNEINSQLSNQ